MPRRWAVSTSMRPAWIEVDTGAYESNLRNLAEYTGRPVIAVVKANAYGHGLDICGPAAERAGAMAFGVALTEEGLALRQAGVEGRIFLLGLSLPEQSVEILASCLEPLVSRQEQLDAFEDAALRLNTSAAIHIKVETGMNRLGAVPDDAIQLIDRVVRSPRLRLAGVVTHFAAVESDAALTDAQWAAFEPVLQLAQGLSPRPVLHAANSAAGLWRPETWLDAVRAGIVSYGVPPAGPPAPFPLRPAASVKARLVQVSEVSPGARVSYGGSWTAAAPSRLAVAPIGYADGLPWSLSNKGHALVGGIKVPIRGRICMDQLVLDVTAVRNVGVGDEAVFIGRQGEATILAEDVAAAAGTIPYEILTRLSRRLPRIARRTAG